MSDIDEIIMNKSYVPVSENNIQPDITSSKSNIFRYVLIIFILSFLGFNLFHYLGDITQYLSNLFRNIAKFLGITLAETTKTATDITATGITTGTNIIKEVVDTSATNLQNSLTQKNNIDNSLNIALEKENKRQEQPLPDDGGSNIQSNISSKKSGWCYVGKDNGFRSCAEVTEADICMSGNIFPTRDICINPNLRE